MLCRLQYRLDCVSEFVREALETFVVGGLQDDTVLRQQHAAGLFPSAVLPPLLLNDLDGAPCARAQGDLLNLARALDREAVLAKSLLNLRDVFVHLTDGAEANLTQHQRQGLLGQGHIPAFAFHRLLLMPFTVNLTPVFAYARDW